MKPHLVSLPLKVGRRLACGDVKLYLSLAQAPPPLPYRRTRSKATPSRPAIVPTPSTLTLQFAGGSAPLINEVDAQELLPVRFAPLASASTPNTTEPI